MLGTATTASDYKRPLDTLRMAINGNMARQRCGLLAQAARKKHAFAQPPGG